MGKLYWVFIVGFCALLGYAGATGNFGIIPKLPFELPSKHQLAPQGTMLNTYILGQTSARQVYPIGLTVAEFQEQTRASGGDLDWARTADDLGWLLTVSGIDEMTNQDTRIVFRLEYRAKGSPSGGPITVITDVAYNGDHLDDYNTQGFLLQMAADHRAAQAAQQASKRMTPG